MFTLRYIIDQFIAVVFKLWQNNVFRCFMLVETKHEFICFIIVKPEDLISTVVATVCSMLRKRFYNLVSSISRLVKATVIKTK